MGNPASGLCAGLDQHELAANGGYTALSSRTLPRGVTRWSTPSRHNIPFWESPLFKDRAEGQTTLT